MASMTVASVISLTTVMSLIYPYDIRGGRDTTEWCPCCSFSGTWWLWCQWWLWHCPWWLIAIMNVCTVCFDTWWPEDCDCLTTMMSVHLCCSEGLLFWPPLHPALSPIATLIYPPTHPPLQYFLRTNYIFQIYLFDRLFRKLDLKNCYLNVVTPDG